MNDELKNQCIKLITGSHNLQKEESYGIKNIVKNSLIALKDKFTSF